MLSAKLQIYAGNKDCPFAITYLINKKLSYM